MYQFIRDFRIILIFISRCLEKLKGVSSANILRTTMVLQIRTSELLLPKPFFEIFVYPAVRTDKEQFCVDGFMNGTLFQY